MKAIQMTAIKELDYVEVATPEPKEDEVLLEIKAVGICGSDIPRILKSGPHTLPIIPGHEFAGKVVGIGRKVKNWEIGDKASAAPMIPCFECEWCKKGIYSLCEDYQYYGSRNDGAFAQYLAVKETCLLPIGKDTPYAWGVTIDPAANAIHAYLRANGNGNDTVCVFGLGAIGLFAIQYAKVLGCKKIVAVDIDDGKLETAKACGATMTVNSLKEDPVKKILDDTDHRGVTLSLEMSGAPICQHQAILSTGRMGRVVYLGISHEPLHLSEKAVDQIERYQLSIIGSWNSFSAPYPGKEWTEAAKRMDEKKFDPDLLISHRLGLEECPDIFRQIDEKKLVYNKIMFFPNGMNELK